MITIPKQDKTTISVNAECLILIEQEEDTGESQRIFISPQMAGRLIDGIKIAETEAVRRLKSQHDDAPELMSQGLRKARGVS